MALSGLLRLIHDGIGQVLKRWLLETGAAPGGSAFVAAWRGGRWRTAQGVAGVYSSEDRRPVQPDTIYDLASLTKPLMAATLARMVRRGAVTWDTPLAAVLPVARGTLSAAVSLEALASHRAGLQAHVRLRDQPGPNDVERWLELCSNARRLDCVGEPPPVGFAPLYSDLGYILIGAALEAMTRIPLAELVMSEVCTPLQIELGPAAIWKARLGEGGFLERVAPTEVVAERGGQLLGVVHDDNAWDLQGSGLAGHAGLFGIAECVGQFGMCMLDALAERRDDWLTSEEAAVLIRARPGGSLLMGFDGKALIGSSAGEHFGARSFGHLGFTGTSLWCDPDAQITVDLLTNRVSPTRENIIIRSVRPDVHGALFGLGAGLSD